MSSWKNIFKEAGCIQYKSWKTSKVMKFKNCFIFQACKFMEFYFNPGKSWKIKVMFVGLQ